jgi:hypothetical protein
MRYTWLYETRVVAIDEDVTITEFGAFSRKPGGSSLWEFSTIYDRPFNAMEFADWYSCPDAVVRLGSDCVDTLNYTGSDDLSASDVRWYFVGRTRSGRTVKGEAIIQASSVKLEAAAHD